MNTNTDKFFGFGLPCFGNFGKSIGSCGSCRFYNFFEGFGVADSQLRKHFPVEPDVSFFKEVDKFAVGDVKWVKSCVDSLYPQLAHIAFPLFSSGESMLPCANVGLLCSFE